MSVPFVHSNFERAPDDFYPTIDRRCVYGFLEHFRPESCVDICAPTGSGIVDAMKECGVAAACGNDAYADAVAEDWIVTNPPYSRPAVDDIVRRQIARVENGEVIGFAALLRSNFDFAKSRKDMFESSFYYGQIKLRFRPWWSEERKAQPIHNYVWHIWKGERFPPVVLYADGVKP